MKVVAASEMVRAEGCAFAAGAVDSDFMEVAGRGVAVEVQRLTSNWSIEWNAVLLCGKGNNAGDAYVAGCHLLEMGYHVEAVQLAPIERSSRLCRENHDRFLADGGIVHGIEEGAQIELPSSGFIVDAILGTGFHGEVEGLYLEAIERANRSGLPIFSIDIPSGVSGDHGLGDGSAIVAVATLFLGLPKRGFFLGKAWECVGELVRVDFGIEQRFLDDAQGDLEMLTEEAVCQLLPRVPRTRHKYEAGAVTAIAGSESMPGAAQLCCMAALRAGGGLVRLLTPSGPLSGLPPEIIRLPADHEKPFDKCRSVLIGPGVGLDETLGRWLSKIDLPCVIDADLLTLISRNPDWPLPEQCVLTPHIGEFHRLIGKEGLGSAELLEEGAAYAERIGRTLVLKGAPTFIFHPGFTPVVSPAGDPAMATAGSGDVLTGVIAALLAGGLSTWEAAQLGVFVHGLAGQLAAQKRTVYGVIASDIIEELPAAFHRIAAARTLGQGVVTPTPGFAAIGPND